LVCCHNKRLYCSNDGGCTINLLLYRSKYIAANFKAPTWLKSFKYIKKLFPATGTPKRDMKLGVR
jgi:hypothetical protein